MNEDEEDEDEDYPYDWSANRTAPTQNYPAKGKAVTRYDREDGAVIADGDTGYQEFGDGSDDEAELDDTGSWTKVENEVQNTAEEDLFGSSASGVDIFATETEAKAGSDFFFSSPEKSVPTSQENSSAGGDFFSGFGAPVVTAAPPVSSDEDLFATAGGEGTSDKPADLAKSSDAFGGGSTVFSFSSLPAPVGQTVEPTPTPDEAAAADEKGRECVV